MGYVAFVLSLIVSGAIASLIKVDTGSTLVNHPDYHLVPYAGDAFGA
ncbi:MAG: hypothetical protein Q4G41_07460 [Coriobacteriales bacterium]|jgi:hypothetical protein|nr:hypothetical protein [Coriobacteriales bacterium]MDO5709940.1 hypothetical protein [Coriobacteriales bacterium]